MVVTTKQWLRDFPWENVVEKNKALCQGAEISLQLGRSYHAACQLWEKAVPQPLTLAQALRVCLECHNLAPFQFYNSPTFGALGRKLVEELVQSLPPMEAEMVRNTVGHYVVGSIGKKELDTVLGYLKQDHQPGRGGFWSGFFSMFRRSKSQMSVSQGQPQAH